MGFTTRSWFLVLYALSLHAIPTSCDDTAYAQALVKFKQSLTNVTKLDDWKEPLKDKKLCIGNTNRSTWTGCLCFNGVFVGLKLEGMGLGGKLDFDSLSGVPLMFFSVMYNNFQGPFPSVNKIGKLRSLYLANNSFSGNITDDAFKGINNMKKVDIGNNSFTGAIPVSLLGLSKLEMLNLENNQFEGRIPDFWQGNLTVDFSNNKLDGPIPRALNHQKASSFFGNPNLCGEPVSPCKQKKSYSKIAIIIASVLVISLAAFIILFLIFRRRAKPLKYVKSIEKSHTEEPEYTKGGNLKNGERGKLYFVRNDREKFGLEELLRASAEVLGSGSFGSSYKAVLSNGHPYVVRRFRQMSNVGREEFYEHMRRLGRLSHPNLLPLVAFYFRKDEKLLITDFVERGSLASHLHGKRSPDQPSLDWPTRLRIIKGVAKGLAYLYKELPSLTLPHGHLKSSNVLLDSKYDPRLSDYALIPVINKDHSHQFMVAYKSPESKENDPLTRKTDVWSLGILILELLTGRFPANYLKQGRGPSPDLATWVSSVVREEWTGEVFDKDMSLARNGEGQMLRLLKIGMCCCEWNVEKRWDLNEAVEKIEELKERDSDDDYSSYASEGDLYSSSRAMTDDDDDLSFSRA